MGAHLTLMPAGLTGEEILVWHADAAWNRLVAEGPWDPDPSDIRTMGDDCWSTLAVMAGHGRDYTAAEREVIATALIDQWRPRVTCGCGATVPADEVVEGTCGAAACLRYEAAARRADLEGARV